VGDGTAADLRRQIDSDLRGDAGIGLACDLVEGIRASGAFARRSQGRPGRIRQSVPLVARSRSVESKAEGARIASRVSEV